MKHRHTSLLLLDGLPRHTNRGTRPFLGIIDMNEKQKPWAITQEELSLRFDLKEGKITLRQLNRRYKQLIKQGKITRNGKAVKE